MADGAGAEWPDAALSSPERRVSARDAVAQGMPGWPRPGEEPPGPTRPVPSGRGGDQRIPRPYNARAGGPPPWAHLAPGERRPSVADVRAALAGQGPPRPSERELSDGPVRGPERPSAVLVPLYDDEDGLARVVLTRRTWGLRTHQGEVSFPGGRVEPGEAPVDAARRESEEEIGLDPTAVEVFGELDHLATISSGSFIAPFVGMVQAVLHVPLAELLDPEIFREEIWTFPGGRVQPITFFELVGDTVWGATASLLRLLLGIATGTLGRGDLNHP
jgi:8-oxo-dGTP pyrophosphatase MutT (NUDIX family)